MFKSYWSILRKQKNKLGSLLKQEDNYATLFYTILYRTRQYIFCEKILQSNCQHYKVYEIHHLKYRFNFILINRFDRKSLKIKFITEINDITSFFLTSFFMFDTGTTGRVPLWLVGTIVGTLAICLLAVFFYGSYVGLGSSLLRIFYMMIIFQLVVLAFIALSFLLVVGVPVTFASPDSWSQNKGLILSRSGLWLILVFVVGILNSFVV